MTGDREYQRYLRLLGVEPGQAGYDLLVAVTEAHIARVPFENISKVLFFHRDGLTTVVPLEQYLDGIEQYHFGGTCYANASHFNELLTYLGFEARLCGADMANPDVHLVNMVKIDGREYLIDVGYGAPLWTPIPLDSDRDIAIEFGEECYLLHPRDDSGHSRMEHLRRGNLIHGYTAKPVGRDIYYFQAQIADSFRPDATFRTNLMVARYSPEESAVIRQDSLTYVFRGCFFGRTIDSHAQLPALVETYFGIPRDITESVLPHLMMR